MLSLAVLMSLGAAAASGAPFFQVVEQVILPGAPSFDPPAPGVFPLQNWTSYFGDDATPGIPYEEVQLFEGDWRTNLNVLPGLFTFAMGVPSWRNHPADTFVPLMFVYEAPAGGPDGFDPATADTVAAVAGAQMIAAAGDGYNEYPQVTVALRAGYQYTVVIAEARGNFGGSEWGNVYHLEVSSDTAAPEPATFGFLGAGLLGLALLRRGAARA